MVAAMDRPETLWAPWRMEYIRQKKREDGCIFCAFPSRDTHREDLVLAVQPHAFVCLNRYPFASCHVLVCPRAHVATLDALPAEAFDATMRLVRESVTRLRGVLSADGFNVGMNLGSAAGAGIAEHMHVHIVPRWFGDTNFMPVLGDVRVMPEYLDQTYEHLLPAFADLGRGS